MLRGGISINQKTSRPIIRMNVMDGVGMMAAKRHCRTNICRLIKDLVILFSEFKYIQVGKYQGK